MNGGEEFMALAAATAAVFTALVFIQAAWHKAADFDSFRGFVADYRLVPDWAVMTLSGGLVAAEIAVVLALAIPAARGVAAGLAMALLFVYAVGMAVNLLRGREHIACGCGGPVQPLSWSLIARNVVLMGIAALAMPIDAALSAGDRTVAVAGGVMFWIGFTLVQQILANAVRARSRRSEPVP